MILSKFGALAMSLALMSAPAMASSFITDPIANPSSLWAGIDYWGVQVSQFSFVDQTLTFNIEDDSRIDIFIQGSPKFQFTDLLLNGQSIAGNFSVNGSPTLQATGYAAAGTVSLRFLGDYSCTDCWGDWFGGYVQVTQAAIPANPAVPGSPAVPEPASWAMMVAGMSIAGAAIRRHRANARAA